MSFFNVSDTIILQEPSQITSIIIQIQSILYYFGLILVILGTFGFVGNCFTFLHPTIRRNNCSIYSLCSAIADEVDLLANLLSDYLNIYVNILPLQPTSFVCKLIMFKRIFLSQLSISFLILALIDRYACSCQLTSKWRKMNQLSMVPWMIALALLYSFSIGIQAVLFYDVTPSPVVMCVARQSFLCSILYIISSLVIQLIVLSVFTVRIFQNIKLSRRRVNVVIPNRLNRQFIRMIILQVLLTGLLSFQWLCVYTFFLVTTEDVNRWTFEQMTIIFFVFSLSYQIFYINNVKFFYLSTLTSVLYRKTLKTSVKMFE